MKFKIERANHCGAILSTASRLGINPIHRYKTIKNPEKYTLIEM